MDSAPVKVEILINATPYETRVATIENGLLQEIQIERPGQKGYVNNIYKGKVVRVLPGMQAAFVDIGLERAGFLHVLDVMPLREETEPEIDLNAPEADVTRWLHEGQQVIVQIIKDPLGTKGARLTMHLSIAARHLVHMPDLSHIGISLRLESDRERERLMHLMGELLATNEPKGYIVRTVADGVDISALAEDKAFLDKLWQSVDKQANAITGTGLIYEDLPLVERVMRDMVNTHVETVRIDSESVYDQVCNFCEQYMPTARNSLTHYEGDMPIFEMYGVEDELARILKPTVPLKSGGYLIIEQTEAMCTIDVNTGGFTGSQNLEETIFKTNLEAAGAIARQLRLRNLGGIIIVDFIDMLDEEHRIQLHKTFEANLALDHARTNISQISALGLIEMTRKRTHESLADQLCEVCPECEGRGKVKTVETLCYEIFREIMRESRLYSYAEGFMVIAASAVVDCLLEEMSHSLGELESLLQKPIKLRAEAQYIREQHDIILL